MAPPPPITTFVTAFLNLSEDRSNDKSPTEFINHFNTLADTGVPIYLFISPEFAPLIPSRPNVTVEHIRLEDLQTFKEVAAAAAAGPLALPQTPTPHHDTRAFMTLMNAKVEFVARAMAAAATAIPTPQYAWIDFGIFHVLKDRPASARQLQLLAYTRFKAGQVYVPGCWDRGVASHSLFSSINWRFCGGFFLGDRAALIAFSALYRRAFPELLAARRALTWETNLWHALELHYGWRPTWFKGDHNDSILRVPATHIHVVASLTTIPPRIGGSACAAIASLLPQVEEVYLSVANRYERFPEGIGEFPAWLAEPAFSSKVSVVSGADHGPASKYLGALAEIPDGAWIFVGDDDQEYAGNCVARMLEAVGGLAVYQNHYGPIRRKTSGGMIHGYVGNLIPKALLAQLPRFPLPAAARFVDDQWMSIYCFVHGIPVLPTPLEEYAQIFGALQNGHEKLGVAALAGLQNRDAKVAELAAQFGVRFRADAPAELEWVGGAPATVKN